MCACGQGCVGAAWAVPEPRPKPTAVTAVAITAIPANLLTFAYRVVMVTPLLKCCAVPSPPTYSVNELRPPSGSEQRCRMFAVANGHDSPYTSPPQLTKRRAHGRLHCARAG